MFGFNLGYFDSTVKYFKIDALYILHVIAGIWVLMLLEGAYKHMALVTKFKLKKFKIIYL